MGGQRPDEHERFLRENAVVDAIADDCASERAQIAACEARILRRLAHGWELAQQQTSRIASKDSRHRDMPLRCMASEIGVHTHVNDRTVQTQMFDAWRLVTRFAATVSTLEAGRITKAHAHVVLDAGDVIEDDSVRAAFEAVVLEWAASETVGRTRAYARRLAEKFDPRPMQQRHAAAAEETTITLTDLEHGMSEVRILIETIRAHGIYDRLTQQAIAIEKAETARRQDDRRSCPNSGGDPASDVQGVEAVPEGGATDEDPDQAFEVQPRRRTRDQVRVDILTDLLLTGTPMIDPTIDLSPGGLGAIRARVDITMPITTLTSVTQGGAEIAGQAPIDPCTARRLAGDTAVWNRVMLHPVTAVTLAVDRYEPTPAQRRFVQIRDQHCRWPGCRMPARRCQVDHNHEHHEGGRTSLDNLGCFCVRHHTMKTETEWTVRQLDNGRLEFSSPSGRTSRNDPPPRVMFVPEDPPPF